MISDAAVEAAAIVIASRISKNWDHQSDEVKRLYVDRAKSIAREALAAAEGL